jgi:Zn-dependent protease with chaperone function
MSVYCFYINIDFLLMSLHLVHQMEVTPDMEPFKSAIEGENFLVQIRSFWIGLWLLIIICVYWGIYQLSLQTVYLLKGIIGLEGDSFLNSIELSIVLIKVAINAPLRNSFVDSLIHTSLSLYITFCWVPIIASVLSFFIQQYIRARKRQRSRQNEKQYYEQLSRRLTTICQRLPHPIPTPETEVTKSRIPFARAYRASIWRSSNIIEITTRCFEELSDKELDALISHELCHIAYGHCFTDKILSFVGRITFVGDGFVRALEDSYRYEIRADMQAVSQLGIDPIDLVQCIEKIHHIGAFEVFRKASMGISAKSQKLLKDDTSSIVKLDSLSFTNRIWLGMTIFVPQYLGINGAGYWYPAVAHRTALLRKLSTPNGASAKAI